MAQMVEALWLNLTARVQFLRTHRVGENQLPCSPLTYSHGVTHTQINVNNNNNNPIKLIEPKSREP